MSILLFADATAFYRGKYYEMDLKSYITRERNTQIDFCNSVKRAYFVDVEKLTKGEEALLSRALNEYDLEKGDVYEVILLDENSSNSRNLTIIVVIDSVSKKSYNYTYWAFGVSFL